MNEAKDYRLFIYFTCETRVIILSFIEMYISLTLSLPWPSFKPRYATATQRFHFHLNSSQIAFSIKQETGMTFSL